MKRPALAVAVVALTFTLASCGDSTNVSEETTTISTTVTMTEQSEADSQEDLRKRLHAMAPVNQVNERNLQNACIMAIHEEIPDAGDYDFSTPIDPGEPDSAEIYAAGGDFRYEVANDVWNDAAYFCTIYTENGVITDSSAVVIG